MRLSSKNGKTWTTCLTPNELALVPVGYYGPDNLTGSSMSIAYEFCTCESRLFKTWAHPVPNLAETWLAHRFLRSYEIWSLFLYWLAGWVIHLLLISLDGWWTVDQWFIDGLMDEEEERWEFIPHFGLLFDRKIERDSFVNKPCGKTLVLAEFLLNRKQIWCCIIITKFCEWMRIWICVRTSSLDVDPLSLIFIIECLCFDISSSMGLAY